MKNTLIILFLFVLENVSVQAQSKSLLKVGDKAPPLSSCKWIVGKPLESLELGRTYVIEFGATWCTPCAAAIPALSDLAEKHKADVSVVSMFVMENGNGLNPDYVSKVERYVRKRADKILYTVGVDNAQSETEKAWLTRAGLIGVPHIFVVDRNQVIRWIGHDPKQVEKALETLRIEKDNASIAALKSDAASNAVTYDPHKLLLIEGNGGNETTFLFRSLFTKYDGKIRGANMEFIQNFYWLKPDSLYDEYQDKFELIGVPIGELYYIAYSDTLPYNIHGRSPWLEFPDPAKNPYHKTNYGNYWHEPIIEVDNEAPFAWKRKSYYNRYNYSLKVPKGMGTALFMQSTMRRDLETYFGYYATVETRPMPYWSLTASDKSAILSRLKSKDQTLKHTIIGEETRFILKNAIVRDIISFLGRTYGFRSFDYGKVPPSEQAAFIDETGIGEKIDFSFDTSLTFEQARAYLKELGFNLSKSHRPMKTVVIRNSQPSVISK